MEPEYELLKFGDILKYISVLFNLVYSLFLL